MAMAASIPSENRASTVYLHRAVLVGGENLQKERNNF